MSHKQEEERSVITKLKNMPKRIEWEIEYWRLTKNLVPTVLKGGNEVQEEIEEVFKLKRNVEERIRPLKAKSLT